MAELIKDNVLIKVAVSASAGAGGGTALVPTVVGAAGFSRARFIFNFGNGGASTASLSTGLGVWGSADSSGTFTLIAGASAVAVTSGGISAASPIILIDVPVTAGNSWLKLSGSINVTSAPHSAVVELYSGIHNPPTSVAQQVITV